MNKVYVPQVPSKMDESTRVWIPTVNLQPAQRFGTVEVLLPPGANRLAIKPLTDVIKEKLQDITEDDYILALGDPTIIGIVSVVAARNAGRLRVLKWDRNSRDYFPVEISF
jgi:hypothetical protein